MFLNDQTFFKMGRVRMISIMLQKHVVMTWLAQALKSVHCIWRNGVMCMLKVSISMTLLMLNITLYIWRMPGHLIVWIIPRSKNYNECLIFSCLVHDIMSFQPIHKHWEFWVYSFFLTLSVWEFWILKLYDG